MTEPQKPKPGPADLRREAAQLHAQADEHEARAAAVAKQIEHMGDEIRTLDDNLRTTEGEAIGARKQYEAWKTTADETRARLDAWERSLDDFDKDLDRWPEPDGADESRASNANTRAEIAQRREELNEREQRERAPVDRKEREAADGRAESNILKHERDEMIGVRDREMAQAKLLDGAADAEETTAHTIETGGLPTDAHSAASAAADDVDIDSLRALAPRDVADDPGDGLDDIRAAVPATDVADGADVRIIDDLDTAPAPPPSAVVVPPVAADPPASALDEPSVVEVPAEPPAADLPPPMDESPRLDEPSPDDPPEATDADEPLEFAD